MAEPALIVLPALPAGTGRVDAAVGTRRPGVKVQLYRRGEAPAGRIGAEPQTGDDATDYTAFSMVGVAG